jgi:FdhD protein
MADGTIPAAYLTVKRKGWEAMDAEVIEESYVSLFVNGIELATIACSPLQQDALALGFLANEGIIAGLEDVRAVHICPSGTCVDVWLAHAEFERPERLILTSGCGGGVTFDDLSSAAEPLSSTLTATPEQLWARMDDLYKAGTLYSRARGVHTSGIANRNCLLMTAEDVGRHNTLDKLRGLALQSGVQTRDRILLSTGRISSEMLNKARRMEIPIVCSRTSPTSLSIKLAETWNITLVGYTRRNSMNVYTHPERLGLRRHESLDGKVALSTT